MGDRKNYPAMLTFYNYHEIIRPCIITQDNFHRERMNKHTFYAWSLTIDNAKKYIYSSENPDMVAVWTINKKPSPAVNRDI
jgi:hypothetical protein